MMPSGPTFWRLDGRNHWGADLDPSGQNLPVADGAGPGPDGLMLSANPASPLGLTSPDGSLGALVLPQRFALAPDGVLYLLGPRHNPWLKRFDRVRQTFVLLAGIGGKGAARRQFRRPRAIAIAGRYLYVADTGNRRVQVFLRPDLGLRYIWRSRRRWRPWNVAAHGHFTYILERRRNSSRVLEHRSGAEKRRRVKIPAEVAQKPWSRIAVDRAGLIYLVSRQHPYLAIFDRHGNLQPPKEAIAEDRPPDAGPYRDQFDAPPFRLDDRGRFCLPADLLGPCDCHHPAGVDLERPLSRCPPWSRTGITFDSLGNPVAVDPATAVGPPIYLTKGQWTSGRLDSRIHCCQWHRIELDVGRLPVGTRLEVETYAANGPLMPQPDSPNWETSYQASGAMPSERYAPPPLTGCCSQATNPASTSTPSTADVGGPHEFLVQSRGGRYLWIRITLAGNGYATPAVRGLTVHYPRASYLDYLPTVYRAEDESSRFLEQFLSGFQTTWDGLEDQISNIARYFDPKGVPAGDPMTYLAAWLALPLEGNWTDAQRRRMLAAAPKLTAQRGTVAGLRGFLRVMLANIAGDAVEQMPDFPALVEGFRERRRVTLDAPGQDRVGWLEELAASARGVEHGTPLWSESVVGRLRLGPFQREGQARVVSTGTPGLDLYQQHAHRFRVIVPAAWIPSAEAESVFRRALEAEKPAHTQYELCLIEPRFRVGVQSTVGHDTLLGKLPRLRLVDLCDPDIPPSRPPRHRLGYDTFLAGPPDAGEELQLDAGIRMEIDAVIT